jgi:AcrR family transcriptional regulator
MTIIINIVKRLDEMTCRRHLQTKEREYIKKRLMEEAQDCLRLYGIRKTTVDELVKRANIPKGRSIFL